MDRSVKNEILHRVKVEGKDRMKKGNWNDHMWRRNCPVQHAIEREREGWRRGRRTNKLILDDLKENRNYSKVKEERLYITLWRNSFGKGCGPIARQTKK